MPPNVQVVLININIDSQIALTALLDTIVFWEQLHQSFAQQVTIVISLQAPTGEILVHGALTNPTQEDSFVYNVPLVHSALQLAYQLLLVHALQALFVKSVQLAQIPQLPFKAVLAQSAFTVHKDQVSRFHVHLEKRVQTQE